MTEVETDGAGQEAEADVATAAEATPIKTEVAVKRILINVVVVVIK